MFKGYINFRLKHRRHREISVSLALAVMVLLLLSSVMPTLFHVGADGNGTAPEEMMACSGMIASLTGTYASSMRGSCKYTDKLSIHSFSHLNEYARSASSTTEFNPPAQRCAVHLLHRVILI